MSTRCYFDSATAAGISPSGTGSWANSPPARLRLNRTTPAGSAMATVTGTSSATNPQFRMIRQYILEGLAAQTISGTIKGQMRCSESAIGLNATLCVAVGKCASDGTGVTQILAPSASDNTAATPPEMVSATLTNRTMQDSSESTPMSLTSTAVSLNDALIVEIGWRQGGGDGSRTASFRHGDAAGADLGEDNTSTTDNNPWIEFSMDIVLASDPTAGQPTMRRWGGVPFMGLTKWRGGLSGGGWG